MTIEHFDWALTAEYSDKEEISRYGRPALRIVA